MKNVRRPSVNKLSDDDRRQFVALFDLLITIDKQAQKNPARKKTPKKELRCNGKGPPIKRSFFMPFYWASEVGKRVVISL